MVSPSRPPELNLELVLYSSLTLTWLRSSSWHCEGFFFFENANIQMAICCVFHPNSNSITVGSKTVTAERGGRWSQVLWLKLLRAFLFLFERGIGGDPRRDVIWQGVKCGAMSAMKCSEVLVNGPGDTQSSVHLERPARGHGDTGQLKEKRDHAQERQLQPDVGHNGECKWLSHLSIKF